MYKILIFTIALSIITPAYADFITKTGLAPNYGGYQTPLNRQTLNTYNKIATRHQQYRRPCLNCNSYGYRRLPSNGLSALEKYSMNKTFKRDSDLSRLTRLENLAFGAEQYGDLDTRFRNVETTILSRPQHNSKNSILSNLANYFIGQSTGYTPSLNSSDIPFYPTYTPPQGFNNQRYDQYSNGIFSSGHKFTDGGFGNQSLIRILD